MPIVEGGTEEEMDNRPTSTDTFLFSSIEVSVALWGRCSLRMKGVLRRYGEIAVDIGVSLIYPCERRRHEYAQRFAILFCCC